MKCPMCTRRAPETDAGGFVHVLTQLLDASHNSVFFQLASNGASEEDMGLIMRDFEAARRHLW